jgi:hypothetical protein
MSLPDAAHGDQDKQRHKEENTVPDEVCDQLVFGMALEGVWTAGGAVGYTSTTTLAAFGSHVGCRRVEGGMAWERWIFSKL